MTPGSPSATSHKDLLRIHQFLAHSRANGPGTRAVIWVQGCSLGCHGCFNPETHAFEPGKSIPVEALFQRLIAIQSQIEGITISGGEPLQQYRPLIHLLSRIRLETRLSVLLFSGFTWEEIQHFPDVETLLACVDLLIAGRYDASQRLAQDLRGSANKRLHFLSGRYSETDLQPVPEAEVLISPGGEVILSGIDPIAWV